MATTLRFINPDGSVGGIIPGYKGLSAQEELNQTGTLSFNIPANAPGADLIPADRAFFGIMQDGELRDDYYILEDDGDDLAAAEQGAREITVGGRGVLALFEDARVYPELAEPGLTKSALAGLAQVQTFDQKTPGYVMRLLIQKAQARGALPSITYNFDDEVDSAGQRWGMWYSFNLDAGIDLLKVLNAMTDAGWCDVRMDGLGLRMYKPDTYMNIDRPDVVIHLGQEVLSAPRKRTRRNIYSHILALGDERAGYEAVNYAALSRYGRREGYESQGGITDQGTLGLTADKSVEQAGKVAEGFSLDFDPNASSDLIPGRDFKVGDRIRYSERRLNESELEPMRVRGITTSWSDDTGVPTCAVELNDLFVEGSVRLKRAVDGILNGSTSTNRPPTESIDPSDILDRIAPKSPTSCQLSTAAVPRENGLFQGVGTVSWVNTILNVDGSDYDDAGHYEVQYRTRDPRRTTGWTQWSEALSFQSTPGVLNNLPVGFQAQARVRTIDSSGNWDQLWGESPIVTVAVDGTPPAKPSKPIVGELLGGARVSWDGLTADGGPMDADLAFVEVHVSKTSAFTPNKAQLVQNADGSISTAGGTNYDHLSSAGTSPIAGFPYADTLFVKFVAVDQTGNRSIPSDEVSVKMQKVVGDDILEGVFEAIALADGSVTAAKIAEGAITKGKISGPAVEFGNIATNAVSAENLTIGAVSENAVPNSNFVEAGSNGFAAKWVSTQGTATFANPGVRITTTGTQVTTTGPIPVTPGDKWFARFVVTPTSGTPTVTLTAMYLNAAGASAGIAVQQTATAASAGQVVNALISVPTNDAIVGMRLRVTMTTDGGVLLREVSAQRMTGSANILDAAIITAKIDDAAVVSAKIRDAAIINAKIDSLAVNDAKIGNVSVGKLTAGILTADMTLSARIRTGQTGSRVEMDASGLRAYNQNNINTVNISSFGTISIQGNIYAETFFSTGYKSGGTGWIEIGNTGQADTLADEIRFFLNNGANQTVSSIRNPSDQPGTFRISVNSSRPAGSTGGALTFGAVYTFSSQNITSNNQLLRITNNAGAGFVASQGDAYMFAATLGMTVAGANNQGIVMRAADAQNTFIRNLNSTVGIKFSGSTSTFQVRNGQDSAYGDFEARDVIVNGNLLVKGTSTGTGGGGTTVPTNPTFQSLTVTGQTNLNTLFAASAQINGQLNANTFFASAIQSNGNLTVQGQLNGNNIYANYIQSNGNMFASGTLRSNGMMRTESYFEAVLNISTTNGNFYSRGAFVGSNPERKQDITPLTVDAVALLSDVGLYAWNWRPNENDEEPERLMPGVGLITSELPYLVTPDAGGGNGDFYNQATLDAVMIQAIRQMDARIKLLENPTMEDAA